MKKTLTLFTLFLVLSSAKATEIRPRYLTEFGMIYTQTALIYPAKMVWMDYDLIVHDHPDLAHYQPAELESLILGQLAYLTSLQQNWEGILMKTLTPSVRRRTVSHPKTYIRASVATLGEGFTGQVMGSLFDIKGTGFSIEGESRLLLYKDMLAALAGEEAQRIAIDQDQVEAAAKNVAEYERALREVAERSAGVTDPEEIQAWRLQEKSLREQRAVWKAFHDGMKGLVEKDTVARDRGREELIAAFRSGDYMNGLFPVDRGLKEIAVERAAHRLFTDYNQAYGTNYSTVRNYFLIELPVEILGPHGTVKRAGLLGRQPHWRAHGKSRESHLPLPAQLIRPVIGGNFQFSADGALVDFEVPEITDARVSDVLGFRAGMGQRFEFLAREAMAKFDKGDMDAPRQLLETTLAPLESPLVLPEDTEITKRRESVLFSRLHRSLRRAMQGQATLDYDGILAAIRRLENEEGDSDQRAAVLGMLLSINGKATARALMNEIDVIADNPREKTGENEQDEGLDPRVRALIGPIFGSVSLTNVDTRSSDARDLMRHLYRRLPDQHRLVVEQIGPEVYRHASISDGHDDLGEGFIPGTMLYEFYRGLIQALVVVLEEDFAPKDIGRIQMNINGNDSPLTEVVGILLSTEPSVLDSLIDVAEKLTGKEMPLDVVGVLDPQNLAKFGELRQMRREIMAQVFSRVDASCPDAIAAEAQAVMRQMGLKKD